MSELQALTSKVTLAKKQIDTLIAEQKPASRTIDTSLIRDEQERQQFEQFLEEIQPRLLMTNERIDLSQLTNEELDRLHYYALKMEDDTATTANENR